MICSNCKGTYKKKHESLTLCDKYIGVYKTQVLDFYKCNDCGSILYTPLSAKQLEQDRDLALEKLLQSLPLCAFISPTETADLLGITRQALHKHRRIRRGFIFQTIFGGKTVYLRDSVEQFLRTGDGRFPLFKKETNITYHINEVNKDIFTSNYLMAQPNCHLFSYNSFHLQYEQPCKTENNVSIKTGRA